MTTTPPAGKRHAFYVDETMKAEHGYIPSVVTEDEPGHTPMRGNGPYLLFSIRAGSATSTRPA